MVHNASQATVFYIISQFILSNYLQAVVQVLQRLVIKLKKRFRINLRARINIAQKILKDYKKKINIFHQFIRKVSTTELEKIDGTIIQYNKYQLRNILNVD